MRLLLRTTIGTGYMAYGVVGKRAWMQRMSPADCNVSSTVYVGLATVAAATWWFLYDAEGPQVTFYQLVSE